MKKVITFCFIIVFGVGNYINAKNPDLILEGGLGLSTAFTNGSLESFSGENSPGTYDPSYFLSFKPNLGASLPVYDLDQLFGVFGIDFGIEYTSFGGELSKKYYLGKGYNPNSSEDLVDVFIGENADFSLSTPAIYLGCYYMTDSFFIFPLKGSVGVKYLFSPGITASENEEILTENFLFYPDNVSERILYDGSPKTRSLPSIYAKIDAEVFERENFGIAAGVSFDKTLGSMFKNSDFTYTSLGLHLTAKYKFDFTKKPFPPLDPEFPEPPEPCAELSIDCKVISKDGSQADYLSVDRFYVDKYYAIPNFVVFEPGETYPESYYNILSVFSAKKYSNQEKSAPDKNNSVYSDIISNTLNIIGKRVYDDPTSRIFIEYPNSSGVSQESKEKADYIRNYFAQTWNIKNSRIQLRTFTPNSKKRPDLIYLSSPNEEPLKPKSLTDKVLYSTIDDILEFKISGCNINGSDWLFRIQHVNREGKLEIVYEKRGAGDPPKEIEVSMKNNDNFIRSDYEYLEYYVEVSTTVGTTKKTNPIDLPIHFNEQPTGKIIIEGKLEDIRRSLQELKNLIGSKKVIIESGTYEISEEAAKILGVRDYVYQSTSAGLSLGSSSEFSDYVRIIVEK